MNLIKQLGGYEQANSKLLKMDKILKEVYYSHSDAQKANELRQAILEYRRQHNIFEESDKIVFVDDFMHGELMTVAWTREGEVWMDDGAKRCTELTMIKHATDAEIKAGRRL